MAKQIWKFEPTPRHIRVLFGGETIIDSKNAMLMIENKYKLDYYFPVEDVQMNLLEKSQHTERSPMKGTASFWNLKVGTKVAENAAWTYLETQEDRPDMKEYIAFQWDIMDGWYEENEEVFVHPRSPYVRVDAIKSSRHIRVVIDDVTVAETNNPHLLFETNLRTRYYIPGEDVQMSLLSSTDTTSICPYKGIANYWSVNLNGDTYPDVVWSYQDPIPEIPKIKGLLAFWEEKDDRIQIYVDGEPTS